MWESSLSGYPKPNTASEISSFGIYDLALDGFPQWGPPEILGGELVGSLGVQTVQA